MRKIILFLSLQFVLINSMDDSIDSLQKNLVAIVLVGTDLQKDLGMVPKGSKKVPKQLMQELGKTTEEVDKLLEEMEKITTLLNRINKRKKNHYLKQN